MITLPSPLPADPVAPVSLCDSPLRTGETAGGLERLLDYIMPSVFFAVGYSLLVVASWGGA